MARLNAANRRSLDSRQFALPEKAPGPGSYPIPDKSHAEKALQLESHASPANQKRIEAAVHRKFPGVGRSRKYYGEK